MDWSALLASTARLIDLHDCNRDVGTTNYAPAERRPGTKTTGIWLNIAIELLQFLYERDLENNEAWVSLETIIENLKQKYQISKDDVLFVANYLATPTRLVSFKEGDDGELQRHNLKRETVLIEWPVNSKGRERCRLSASGSRSVLLSQAAQKWLYAADDAGKLVKAVEYGAYADIPHLAEGLIAQIRRFSKDITMMLERRHLEELLADFASNQEDYLAVIKGVQQSVETASEVFNTGQIKKDFSQWLETESSDLFSPYTIFQSFTDILQAIERLNRKFQKLVSILVSAKREVIGLIRFDEAAVGLAFHPCSQEVSELCISMLGPWSTSITAPIPLDFVGILDVQKEEHFTTTLVFDDEPVDALPSPIEHFLATYRDEIIDALKRGPLSLSRAISNGWLEIDDMNMLPQLVGVYTSPDWLDDPSSQLAVSVEPGALNMLLPDGSRLEGDDLLLHKIKTDPIEQGAS